MTGRLTNKKREVILENVLRETFGSKTNNLKEEVKQLATNLFLMEFGQYQNEAKKLPAGWVTRTSTVRIDHADFYNRWSNEDSLSTRVNTDLPNIEVRMDKEYYGRPYDDIRVDKDHAMYQELADFSSRYVENHKARNELRENVQNILYACTTFKRLEEAWPEYINYMQGMTVTSTSTSLVPVETAKKVNEIINKVKNT